MGVPTRFIGEGRFVPLAWGAVLTGGGGTVAEGSANPQHELGQACASKCGDDEGGATRWRAP